MYSEKCKMMFLDCCRQCIYWLSLVALDRETHQLKSQTLSCLAWRNSINKLLIIWLIIIENVVQPNGNVIDRCMRDNHKKDFSIQIFLRTTRNLQFMSVSVELEGKFRPAHINSSCSIQVCFYYRFSMGLCGRGRTSYDI